MPKVSVKSNKVKAAITAAALLSSPALAEELVVTANRVETAAEKLGSSVSVVTAADIARRQARTADEVLRDLPGLSVSRAGGPGGVTGVRIRGAEAYYTKVIIDGVDMSDPSKPQSSFDFANLLASDIERIEVVRGPQSLLYGSDAIGGVVNIITKKGKGEPKVSAFIEGGSRHTYNGSTNVSGSVDRVSYAFNAARSESDGISSADERNGNSERDGYWNNSFTGKLGLRLTDIWDVEASGRFMRSRAEYDGYDYMNSRMADDNDYMVQREMSGRLATNLKLFDGRLLNTVAYTTAVVKRDIHGGDLYSYGSSYGYRGESEKLEYQGTAKLAENHTLVFGAETKKELTKQEDISKDVRNEGYFLDYQFSPIESLFLTIGGRLDDHETYGTNSTWRGTAAYLVDATQTRFHGSYGTGFKAPSLFQLYYLYGGNPDLDPEKSRGWDLGVEQSFLDGKAMVDVTWFDNRFRNKIDWVPTTGYSGIYENVASARAQGVEVGAHWDIIENWRLNGSYTYTNSRDNETRRPLGSRPKHQGSVGVSWTPIKGLTTDANLRAVGSQYDKSADRTLGGFATVDLAVSYDVTEWARIFARLENLADKKYQEVYGYGTMGRMGYVGVRVAF